MSCDQVSAGFCAALCADLWVFSPRVVVKSMHANQIYKQHSATTHKTPRIITAFPASHFVWAGEIMLSSYTHRLSCSFLIHAAVKDVSGLFFYFSTHVSTLENVSTVAARIHLATISYMGQWAIGKIMGLMAKRLQVQVPNLAVHLKTAPWAHSLCLLLICILRHIITFTLLCM